jgi:drug/metabolite transporter (DMT)-like permease
MTGTDISRRSAILLSFAGLAVFGCAWGATQPLTKVAVSTGHLPLGLIFWQLTFGAILLGAIAAARRMRIGLTARHLVYYLMIGLIGTIVPGVFSYLAIRHLPAGVAALAIATVPMISLTIALAIGNETFRLRRVGGVVLGVTAMMAIALPEASLPDRAMAPWLLVALIAPACYGIEGNVVARLAPRDMHPIAVLAAASATGALIAAPLAWITGQWVDLTQSWEAAEWAILGSAVAHAAAYSGYMWLIAFAGVVFTSQVAYVVTGSAIAMSMIFLGESYSAWVWLAIALMALGLTLVQPAGKMPEPEPASAA